ITPICGHSSKHLFACCSRMPNLSIGSRDRNLLTHGIWWQFDVKEASVIVRSGNVRPDHNQHQTFTVERIKKLAMGFNELEADLYRLQRAIEARERVSSLACA